jgi:protease I
MAKRVAILVDNYFEQAEFEAPLQALEDSDIQVEVVAASQKDLTALQHVDKGGNFTADRLLQDAEAADYDALVLPGGAVNADCLRMNQKARQWVNDFMDASKPIAAICHAPWLLVSADAVEGRRLTSYYTLQDDIRNAGGEWADFPVLVDRNLITSRQPDDLPQFCEALLEALEAKVMAHATR